MPITLRGNNLFKIYEGLISPLFKGILNSNSWNTATKAAWKKVDRRTEDFENFKAERIEAGNRRICERMVEIDKL